IALLWSRAGSEVRLWVRDPVRADEIARTRGNARHLPGIRLPEDVAITGDAAEALEGAELLVAAIPTAFLRASLTILAPKVPAGMPVLSVVKGIEQETFSRPSEILVDVLGPRSVAVLSGPSHAEEAARGLPASVVVAGRDEGLNVAIRDALSSDSF